MGRRDNGYHQIESIFLPIPELCDEIFFHLELNAPLIIKSTGTFAGSIPFGFDNLMAISLQKLGEQLGLKIGGRIQIQKLIPVGAGLGGGSSNAATVLILAKNQLAERGITVCTTILAEVASKVGADVPFFLNPVSSLVKGVGELIEPIKSPIDQLYALLVTPNFEISAKVAYQKFRDSHTAFTPKDQYKQPINDLGSIVSDKYVALRCILDRLNAFSPQACFVSGSGPTCVGLYKTKAQAQSAKKSFSQNFHTILTKL